MFSHKATFSVKPLISLICHYENAISNLNHLSSVRDLKGNLHIATENVWTSISSLWNLAQPYKAQWCTHKNITSESVPGEWKPQITSLLHETLLVMVVAVSPHQLKVNNSSVWQWLKQAYLVSRLFIGYLGVLKIIFQIFYYYHKPGHLSTTFIT